MKIRFINAVCILALILASACKSANASQLKDKEMMITEKKNIGSKLALYPMPVTVVGAEVNGKVNWLLVAHVGIIGHDRILVSMNDKHYTNQGIIESKKLSVNLVDQKMLSKADYVGSVSGASVDKSGVFDFHWGKNGSPVIDASQLVMECNVVDIYKSDGFDNFICSIANTYADFDGARKRAQSVFATPRELCDVVVVAREVAEDIGGFASEADAVFAQSDERHGREGDGAF